jgi:ABC-type nitrate/sulfonate/bicarbonate transport system permease component
VAPVSGQVGRRHSGVRRWGSASLQVTGLIGLVALWYGATVVVPPTMLPLPHEVAARIGQWFGSAPSLAAFGMPHSGLGINLLYTTENVLLASVLSATLGLLVGLSAGRSPIVSAVVSPLASTVATVPVLVSAPFFLIWFGAGGRLGQLVLVTLYSTTIVVIYAQRAVTNLDPVYEHNALSLGTNRRQLLLGVLLPATFPEVLAGIRIALTGAWGLETVAELLGSQNGIGQVINVIASQFDVTGIMAALVCVLVIAAALDWLLVRSAAAVMRWRPS